MDPGLLRVTFWLYGENRLGEKSVERFSAPPSLLGVVPMSTEPLRSPSLMFTNDCPGLSRYGDDKQKVSMLLPGLKTSSCEKGDDIQF
jgi:hypothetical protein